MPFFKKLEGEERKKTIEDPGKSWKQWAREDLARYWYILLCMFIDVFFNLPFTQNYVSYGGLKNLFFLLTSIVILVLIIYAEFKIYKKLFSGRLEI